MTHKDNRFRQALAPLAISLTYACVFSNIAFAQTSDSGSDSPKEHASIVREALERTITPANLSIVESAAAAQSKQGSEAYDDARRHFALPETSRCTSYIDRQKKLALNYASEADSNVESRVRTLFHLGALMHTAQDFYCHSNYIDLRSQEYTARKRTFDPYEVELVDWSKLDKIGIQTGGSLADRCSDSPQIKINGYEYKQIAKILAVRETERQWELFEALIKLRYQTRADAIITALKMASCPKATVESVTKEMPD